MSARPQRRCCLTVFLLAALALVLGLGLGLGLRHKHKSADSSIQTTPGNEINQTLPFLQSPPQSNFVLGSTVKGQSPQTRTYNFTVEQANGAPDGANKTMLVVNGTFLITAWHLYHHCNISSRNVSRSND